MKRILIVCLCIVAIIVTVLGAWFIRTGRRMMAMGVGEKAPFTELYEPWKLPPIRPPKYDAFWFIVRYPEGVPPVEGDLNIKIIDLATGKPEPTDGKHVGGRQGDDQIIAYFRPKAGHRYEVVVDPNQVRPYAERGAILELGMTPAESNNIVGDALFD